MMLRQAPLVLALCVAGCVAVALDPAPSNGYRSAFERLPDRTWIGPEYWANRVQDWRLQGGRVECVEPAPRAALRTLHLLTHRTLGAPGLRAPVADDGTVGPLPEGSFRAVVRLGAIETELPLGADAAAGFLFGAGGEHVDHRLSAQVHGAPAEDGGMLAVVDGLGRVSFRDMSRLITGGGLWSIPMETRLDGLPVPEACELAGEGFGAGGPRPVLLELVAGRYDGRTFATLVARDADDGAVLSTASLPTLPGEQLDGAVALVSHRGPTGGKAGFWFDGFELMGDLVAVAPERAFGPVLCVQYTVDETRPRGGTVLSMTVQMPPLGVRDTRSASLEVRRNGEWELAAVSDLRADSETFEFRLHGWDASVATPYRVMYDLVVGTNRTERTYYEGIVRAAPVDGRVIIADVGCVKHFTGGLRWNEGGLWFPHAEVARHVLAHDPDLVYFSGDQVYEGDISAPVRQPFEKAMGDYLTRWYRWCWSFRELCRERPCITVPDDHDVYHGNIWGNAGVSGPEMVRTPDGGEERLTAQDRGGYTMAPRFVNAVHRTQVAHLPPPHSIEPIAAEPIGAGLLVYHTDVTWGGVSCAVLADRMFKSSASVLVPEGRVRNGWFRNEEFDPRDADVPGAVLLGERQLAFLDEWAADWSGGAWVKVALSQTPFANIATLPAGKQEGDLPTTPMLPRDVYSEGERLAADTDSGGWPQTGRNEALRAFRRAAAVHLAGDQHLASTVRYGIDAFDDGGVLPPRACGREHVAAPLVPARAELRARAWGATLERAVLRRLRQPHDGGGRREPAPERYRACRLARPGPGLWHSAPRPHDADGDARGLAEVRRPACGGRGAVPRLARRLPARGRRRPRARGAPADAAAGQ